MRRRINLFKNRGAAGAAPAWVVTGACPSFAVAPTPPDSKCCFIHDNGGGGFLCAANGNATSNCSGEYIPQ